MNRPLHPIWNFVLGIAAGYGMYWLWNFADIPTMMMEGEGSGDLVFVMGMMVMFAVLFTLTVMPLSIGLVSGILSRYFYFNTGLLEDPGMIDMEGKTAQDLVTEGHYQEAISVLENVLDTEPAEVGTRLDLARVYEEKLEDYDRAIIQYEIANSYVENDEVWLEYQNKVVELLMYHFDDYDRAIGKILEITRRFGPETKEHRHALVRVQKLEAQRKEEAAKKDEASKSDEASTKDEAPQA